LENEKSPFILSLTMIVVSIGTLVVHGGPATASTFAGGTLVQVKFEAPVTIDRIKAGLQGHGYGRLVRSAVRPGGGP
jgi:preprotein translocase subunit SecF